MTDRSKTSSQATLWDTTDATSLLGSEGGTTRSNSPDGDMNQYGLDHAHVNRGRSQEIKESTTTRATYGRISFGLSASQRLTSALASRFRELTDWSGSPEYTLTWSRSRIASGLLISHLRRSGRRMSGQGFTGWPTPTTRDWKDVSKNGKAYEASKERNQPSAVTEAYQRGYTSAQLPYLYAMLMGYPDQWVISKPSATPSSHKSPPPSSDPIWSVDK